MRQALTVCLLGLLLIAGSATARPDLIWIEVPGGRYEIVHSLSKTAALPFLGESNDSGELRSLTSVERQGVDSIRVRIRLIDTPRVDVGWNDAPACGDVVLDLDGKLRGTLYWLDPDGKPTAEFLDAWEGDREWSIMRRIAGLDEELRWEEIEEFLSLSAEQNRAFRSLPPTPEHPLWRMRRAFSADKLFVNAALYYGYQSDAQRIFVVQSLAHVYEDDLLPWSDSLLAATPAIEGEPGDGEAASRRFFLRRLRSSAPRIYSRIDRLLMSFHFAWGKEAILVLDASDSSDPFLAVRAPVPLRNGGNAAEDLGRLLSELGWGDRLLP